MGWFHLPERAPMPSGAIPYTEAMKFKDTGSTGGHRIDPNLVEIADMLRIQDEMHDLTEHAQDRMRTLVRERRTARERTRLSSPMDRPALRRPAETTDQTGS